MSKESVSDDDLNVLKELDYTKEVAKKNSDIATLHQRLADLNHENTLLKIYLKYGLTSKDRFNQETGEIIRGEEYENKDTETESTEGAV